MSSMNIMKTFLNYVIAYLYLIKLNQDYIKFKIIL